jgi:hypothetical protein
MTFAEILAQVVELLQREGRVAYEKWLNDPMNK